MPIVTDIRPQLGCDPEFFFKFKDKIIGAEKVIPKKGLVYNSESKFIIDGVQAELNPRHSYCRAILADEIRACFILLKKELAAKGKDFTVDFSRTVEISEKNLMELNENSRKFGCAPSRSIYDKIKSALKITDVDPEKYRIRAAGGHIHIGVNGNKYLEVALRSDYKRLVELLDIICGNTAVLIDRDKGNIERRKIYGKAGEYRLPKHGLEYRTLSNFWLTSYPLMSFAFGMARLAVQLMSDPINSNLFYNEFTSRVKTKNIHEAINNNNWDLAVDNFHAIEPLLCEVTNNSGVHPINASNMVEFKHFANVVNENNLDYWFKDDPLKHWTKDNNTMYIGFNDFLNKVVRKDIKDKEKVKVA